MNTDDRQDDTIYRVVHNQEEQYSIWPINKVTLMAGLMRARAGQKRNVWLTSRKCGPT